MNIKKIISRFYLVILFLFFWYELFFTIPFLLNNAHALATDLTLKHVIRNSKNLENYCSYYTNSFSFFIPSKCYYTLQHHRDSVLYK